MEKLVDGPLSRSFVLTHGREAGWVWVAWMRNVVVKKRSEKVIEGQPPVCWANKNHLSAGRGRLDDVVVLMQSNIEHIEFGAGWLIFLRRVVPDRIEGI